MSEIEKKQIGFGGGCHWCTEAVFQSLVGVTSVEQGWVASNGLNAAFSEAVVVEYDSTMIDLSVLIQVHLKTHSSTSKHSMREKYRSAIYVYCDEQKRQAQKSLDLLQKKWDERLVTQVMDVVEFKYNDQYQNYYYERSNKAFCQRHIEPKLECLLDEFPDQANKRKIMTALSQK